MPTSNLCPTDLGTTTAQHSFLPPFILLSNEVSSPAKRPAKHSPWIKWDRASHSSMFQNASTATSTSALQPPEAWSPPTPLSDLQILFLLIRHCAEKWPHSSALTPRRHHKDPACPHQFEPTSTPALPLDTVMGSLDTCLPLQGAPHQALCRAKAQAANVLNSAKGSLREGLSITRNINHLQL